MRNQGIRQTPDFGPGSLAFKAYQFPQLLVTLAYLRTQLLVTLAYLLPQLLVTLAYLRTHLFPQLPVIFAQFLIIVAQQLEALFQPSQAGEDPCIDAHESYQQATPAPMLAATIAAVAVSILILSRLESPGV